MVQKNTKKQIIKVECYSGYRADERPLSFIYGGRRLMVDRIIDQWRSPDSEFFKVLADDGKCYTVIHNNEKDNWVLEKILDL